MSDDTSRGEDKIRKAFAERKSLGSNEHHTLHRLPELLRADHAKPVFVVDDEKCADRLILRELVATACPGGLGKWRPEYDEHFKGRHVVILPGRTDADRELAWSVAERLLAISRDVRILELSGLAQGGTLSSFLVNGGTRERLVELVENVERINYLKIELRKSQQGAPVSTNLAPSVAAQAGKTSQADKLVEIAMARASNIELFHDRDMGLATFADKAGGITTSGVRSGRFRAHLRALFYAKYRKAVSSQSMQDAVGLLEAQALEEGKEHRTYVRVADLGDRAAVDLGDHHGAVVVTARGWSIERVPPVRFLRSKTTLPLATPAPSGSVDELRDFVNVGDGADGDDRFRLLVGFLLSALSGRGPFPVLALYGEQDCGKSTTARMVKALVDPGRAANRGQPKDLRDLAIAARNSYLLSYDNLSNLPLWLSDGFCRLATGSGFTTRQLYTDGDEEVFDDRRPLIINGIEEVGERNDLVDRCFILELLAFARARDEEDLYAAFGKARPRIFGALLTALASGIANRANVNLAGKNIRMRDAARLVTAAEPALKWREGSFVKTYISNRAAANTAALDASILAPIILELVPFIGSASKLLEEVHRRIGDDRERLKKLPGTPQHLSGALRRIAPNLRAAGVHVEWDREGKTRARTIRLERVADSPSASSASANNGGSEVGSADDGVADGERRPPPPAAKFPSKGAAADGADGADAQSAGRSGDGQGDDASVPEGDL